MGSAGQGKAVSWTQSEGLWGLGAELESGVVPKQGGATHLAGPVQLGF